MFYDLIIKEILSVLLKSSANLAINLKNTIELYLHYHNKNKQRAIKQINYY